MNEIPIVYSPALEDFHPPAQIDFGVPKPHPEVPERTRRLIAGLRSFEQVALLEPRSYPLEHIQAVHDADYLDFLQTANQRPMVDPETDGLPAAVLFPGTFPFTSLWPARHGSVMADAGYYSFDTYAPITPQVWPAARLAADCALTAADRVREGAPVALAVCRPPGHHALRAKCGGFCYLNHAAIAAQYLTQKGKVAILDVDYHHGNGTQEIFYTSDQVLYVSIHADPAQAYPYFSGWPDEIGAGPGRGYNRNFPLPHGAGLSTYRQALEQALQLIADFRPGFLTLSLGFDIYQGDPLTTFALPAEFFEELAWRIAGLTLPTLIVTEGGYAVERLDDLAARFMRGWLSA